MIVPVYIERLEAQRKLNTWVMIGGSTQGLGYDYGWIITIDIQKHDYYMGNIMVYGIIMITISINFKLGIP